MGEPVCGKDHAALAKQLQIRVRRLALLEPSGAGPSCWGRCERVDRTLLEDVNRHRAGWHLPLSHLVEEVITGLVDVFVLPEEKA